MKKISNFIADKAVILSVFIIIAGIYPLSRLPHIRVDNAIDVWLDHQSPEYRQYAEFQKDYGNDEWILAAFSIEGIPDSVLLEKIGAVADDLQKIDEKIRVISIADADSIVMKSIGDLLISRDRKTAGIFLNLSGLGKIENRQMIVQKIRDALALHSGEYTFHLAGPTLLNAELDRISEHQSRIFMTLAFFIALVCLYAVFRSALYAALALSGAGPAVLLTLGSATATGMRLNMITTVLPVLIWVLSLTGAIHLILRFTRVAKDAPSSKRAVAMAVQDVFPPYAAAAATTAIGFLSLLWSHMAPVRELGVWAAAGIIMGFLCNMILIPALLKHLPEKMIQKGAPEKLMLGIPLKASMIRSRKWLLVFFGFILLAGPLFLVPSIRVESNVLTFFNKNSQIRTDYDYIAKHLTGLATMEMDVQGFLFESLDYVKELKHRLSAVPELRPVVYPAGVNYRVTLFVREMESMEFNRLVKKVKDILSGMDRDGIKVRLTGTVLLLNSVQEELVHTQVKSFGISLLSVVVILALLFRSLPLVLIGTAVNLFPVSVLAGTAAVSGIPLNVATIMIAAVAIGIAVDDTVFFLARLRAEAHMEPDPERAVDITLSHMAAPITFTTLVVSIGFFVLIPADFTPIRYFGILGGLTMIFAWIGDVVYLPALLYALHPKLATRTVP